MLRPIVRELALCVVVKSVAAAIADNIAPRKILRFIVISYLVARGFCASAMRLLCNFGAFSSTSSTRLTARTEILFPRFKYLRNAPRSL